MKLLLMLLLLLSVGLAASLPAPDAPELPTLPASHPSSSLARPGDPADSDPADSDPAKSRFAMLDDVRLLANGLLQLGQSLREFVQKTKAQINDILQKLNIFDRSFYRLSVVTSEIKEEEEELKRTTDFLKANNEEIRNLSMEINSKINGILRERGQLQTKVGSLEERLKGLSRSMVPVEQLHEIASLKDVIEAQERTITELLRAVREQHDQLDLQKNKIKSLEDKLGDDSFQDTMEKVDSDPEMEDMFEYLTANTTGLDTSDLPGDCSELFERGERNSGVYAIRPNQSEAFSVYCEMSPDGGSTVIQRREDGSVDFDQTWERYEQGFGDLEREFWLGLRKVYSLAAQSAACILRIELEDWREERRWVEYQATLGGPATHYALNLSHLSGDLPDAMANHTDMTFSTKDQDNSSQQDANCARNYRGGWWFNACGDTNLNGRYVWLRARGRSPRRKGIHWRPLKATKISIRPADLH